MSFDMITLLLIILLQQAPLAPVPAPSPESAATPPTAPMSEDEYTTLVRQLCTFVFRGML